MSNRTYQGMPFLTFKSNKGLQILAFLIHLFSDDFWSGSSPWGGKGVRRMDAQGSGDFGEGREEDENTACGGWEGHPQSQMSRTMAALVSPKQSQHNRN